MAAAEECRSWNAYRLWALRLLHNMLNHATYHKDFILEDEMYSLDDTNSMTLKQSVKS